MFLACQYDNTGKPIVVAMASILLKFLIKVFKRLYFMNLWMEVHTCIDVGYWAEVLCYTITTHMSDLEVTFLVKTFRGKGLFGRATLSCNSLF